MSGQGTVNTEGFNAPQLKFTVDVLAMLLDNLIQDDIELYEDGTPKPASEQENLQIRQTMELLNYK